MNDHPRSGGTGSGLQGPLHFFEREQGIGNRADGLLPHASPLLPVPRSCSLLLAPALHLPPAPVPYSQFRLRHLFPVPCSPKRVPAPSRGCCIKLQQPPGKQVSTSAGKQVDTRALPASLAYLDTCSLAYRRLMQSPLLGVGDVRTPPDSRAPPGLEVPLVVFTVGFLKRTVISALH